MNKKLCKVLTQILPIRRASNISILWPQNKTQQKRERNTQSKTVKKRFNIYIVYFSFS